MSRAASHAPCAVRYRHGGEDFCGATDTPCIYCADRETNAPEARPPRKRTAGKRARRRDRRNRRDHHPFEDS